MEPEVKTAVGMFRQKLDKNPNTSPPQFSQKKPLFRLLFLRIFFNEHQNLKEILKN
jgi:hypothetical protein